MTPNRIGLPPFPSLYRASGLLMHVTSLPSPYGIGDFGPGALAWIDRLQETGQSWWQALPLGPTGYGNSPYQSLSSFAGNAQWRWESGDPARALVFFNAVRRELDSLPFIAEDLGQSTPDVY